MNPKKQKEKDRRRARKLAEEAWEAVNDENPALALKIIRRAVATQPDNPVLWNDQGLILSLNGDPDQAEDSFQTALSFAPTFAEPYVHLAAIRVRQGRLKAAVALQTQAVKHAPHATEYAVCLQAYRSLIGQSEVTSSPNAGDQGSDSEPAIVPRCASERIASLDWRHVEEQLTRAGSLLVPRLLDGEACAQLRTMFDDDTLFAKTVVMDEPRFGQGVYRYFRAPVPGLVTGLRVAMYPQLARIANGWQQLLGELESYPNEWERFRDRCRDAGQTKPTPILLKYGPGGFNALHRDLRGEVFFPIQMAVVLSHRADLSEPATEGFHGGDFLFCDVPERDKSRRCVVSAGLGDAILFCTRDRLVSVGGVYGLQPVKHGVVPITAGTRIVLGVPFHEYR